MTDSLPSTIRAVARTILVMSVCAVLGVARPSHAADPEPPASTDAAPAKPPASTDAAPAEPPASTDAAPRAEEARGSDRAGQSAGEPAPSTKSSPGAEPRPDASEARTARVPNRAPSGAYHFQPNVFCPFCRITPGYPQGRSGLHWHDHWRAVGVREYVTIPVLGAGILGVELFMPTPSRPRWNSPVLFDRTVRDTLRIGSVKGRRTAETISDAVFVWEILHPTAVDPLLVAWWQRESPLVAWQMFVINAQAYALSFLVTDVVKRAAARQRPWVTTGNCKNDPDGRECGSAGPYQSFFSGHSAITATGAGLICAHHTQLSLYQNDFLDGGTCVLAVLGTATTGAMRIASDNHWVSDVLVGHLTGYLSGYLLPTLLYYREFRAQPHEHEAPSEPVFATLPMITNDAYGLTVVGTF